MKRLLILFLIMLVMGLACGMYWLSRDMARELNAAMDLKTTEKLVVAPGRSLKAISDELVLRKWIRHPYYLLYTARKRKLAGSIKAGEYYIQPGTSQSDLLGLLVAGKVIQYSHTLLEGWTFRQIIDSVKQNRMLVQTLALSTPEYVMEEISLPGYYPEGRFFPDTYLFPANTTDVEFLRRAFEMMRDVLNEEWQRRAGGLPYKTPYQALIMASIIEKETARSEEYRKISGVFVRRLEKGMKLQTDPTVIYALGEQFDGNIRRRDLSFDSPYNTYVYRGLPPTPIAAPGRAAIQAALQPDNSGYLYFVAKGDGSHYFSRTLKEHNQAVAKYQLKRK